MNITESQQDSTAARLAVLLATISAGCTECGLCVGECRFLQRYGTPKKIADGFDPEQKEQLAIPFECSLCGLCAAVCPASVEPATLFLEMRREAVRRGNNQFFEYGGLLGYERKGVSRRFSWYGLPAGCDTVFFPGCALPGTRPQQTRTVFETLQKSIPALAIVFDCCTKPSHDLGREGYFDAMFGEMTVYLVGQGVKNVLVACPNCYKMFSEYAPELKVRTIYEALAEQGGGGVATVAGTVTIHDPCVIRNAAVPQEAVRALVAAAGLTVTEMHHNRRTTLCCGEGGAVACLEPEFADEWGKKRKREAAGRRTVTYCAGCTHMLGAHTPTSHVVDLLADPAATMAGRAKVSKAPFTYLNRLRLKKHFMTTLETAASRERTFTGGEEAKRGGFLKHNKRMKTFLKRLFGGKEKCGAPNPEEIRTAIRSRYAEVACCAEGQFSYLTGRGGAEALGYDPALVAAAPAGMMASFCGVGNPFSLGKVEAGTAVLDIGCGAGFDLYCAACLVGPQGRVTGIDLTPHMVARARQNLAAAGIGDFEISEGAAEELPFEEGSFDLVISNGVLNLSPDKERTFAEIHRVLRPGGRLQFADIVMKEELPPGQMSAKAWSE